MDRVRAAAHAGVVGMLAIAVAGSPARAASDVALTGAVFRERTVQANGQSKIVLEQPRVVVPGDRLVYVFTYTNRGAMPAADVVVTNPMPGAVAFQAAADRKVQVSVNGGRSWGTLATLRVRERDGSVRGARPEDVTHVRWTLAQAVPAGHGGKLSFRGVVR